jgi:hypothetical protein
MTIGVGANARVAYVPEVTWASTPATPAFKNLRVSGGGLDITKQTGRSNELKGDRNVRDEYLLGIDAGGSYPFEMSYGTLDEILEAAFFSAWATNVLKIGSVRKFFTFEEFLELGTTDSYARFPGSMIGAFRLAIAARAAVTGSFDVMSERVVPATTAIASSTYAAANTKDVMTTAFGFGSLAFTGTGITAAPKLRSINLELNNNLRVRPSLNRGAYTEEQGEGDADFTGEFEAYFENNELYNAIIAHEVVDVQFTIGTVTAEKYTFDLPRARLLNGGRRIAGTNDDVIYRIPFRALYSSSDASSAIITRAVA